MPHRIISNPERYGARDNDGQRKMTFFVFGLLLASKVGFMNDSKVCFVFVLNTERVIYAGGSTRFISRDFHEHVYKCCHFKHNLDVLYKKIFFMSTYC